MADANQKFLQSLSEHLRTRGLYEDSIPLNTTDPLDNLILNDEQLLASVAGLHDKIGAITALLKVRILKLQRELVMKCVPEEVMVYRQAIKEIADILDDVKKYRNEYERRTSACNKEEGQVEGTPEN